MRSLHSTATPRETPDVETSSQDYARRFSGPTGEYLLAIQARCVTDALRGLPVGTALDVGGAHGQTVAVLSSGGWNVIVQGTSIECGRNLRELHGNHGPFVTSSVAALPFADCSMDLVIAVRLISHIERWPELIREMCRVARHSVIIDYPAKGALNALSPLLFGLKQKIEGNTRTYTSFTRRELAACFETAGFQVKREQKQFFLPMGLHRAAGGALLRGAEHLARSCGITAWLGSPVILRADRMENA